MNTLLESYDITRNAYLTLIDECDTREQRRSMLRQMWSAIAHGFYLMADAYPIEDENARNIARFLRALIIHGSIHTVESFLESLRRTL